MLKNNKILSEILEWVLCLIVAIVIYLLLNYFVGTITGVKQVSMYPTTKEGDRLVLQRPTIFKKDLNYGDIITFLQPLNSYATSVKDLDTTEAFTLDTAKAKYPQYEGINKFFHEFIGIGKVSYIKRIIGLPNDHIIIAENGEVLRNGEVLDEPYLNGNKTNQNGKFINVIVPEGHIYVMGDNRKESSDSRFFGCVPIEKIDGYVITRIWPFDKIGKIN